MTTTLRAELSSADPWHGGILVAEAIVERGKTPGDQPWRRRWLSEGAKEPAEAEPIDDYGSIKSLAGLDAEICPSAFSCPRPTSPFEAANRALGCARS